MEPSALFPRDRATILGVLNVTPDSFSDGGRLWRGARAESEPADKPVLEADEAERTRRLLAKLPEKLRSVLVLKEYGGMSYREIGQVLGITEGNVKVRAFRAREALLALFEEDGKHVS